MFVCVRRAAETPLSTQHRFRHRRERSSGCDYGHPQDANPRYPRRSAKRTGSRMLAHVCTLCCHNWPLQADCMLKTAKTTRKEFMERVLEIMPWHITANNIRPVPMWCDSQVGEHSGAGFTSQTWTTLFASSICVRPPPYSVCSWHMSFHAFQPS